ncbi:MAG: 4Fe-4S ferredoxin [Deltaproteobacteria bacterium]|nr:MAG: 4Fe-4S ferredoxin [Deltaproteobacteria bacterium]
MEGEPGQFKVTLRKNPRYIDPAKCTACGDCATVCPVVLPSEYDQGLTTRKATYKKYAQAIPGAFAIQKADKAPCRLACPAGLNVQGYVQMVKEGKYKEALEIIMEELPLPGVIGRICPHGCEDACRRAQVDEPVAIRDLKRLAADMFDPREIEVPCLPERKERVAIIGSGPAGLSAAYHLAKRGIKSTIFEALPEAGGMLRVGIPPHRLPREVLDKEIEIITNLGVEIRTNTPLGPELTIDDLFGQGYKAIYLALGAHKGIELGVPGEKAQGVRQGVDFLREVNLTGKAEVGSKVAIIGGGNVAIDVARSAVRLGAEEVTIVYRRTRAEMPAWEEEIQAAEAEGVKVVYLSAPQEILTRDGRVVGLRCIRMELGEPDSSGRRRPIPIPGSEYDMEIDQLIAAIGQRPDLSALQEVLGVEFTKWGTIQVDPITYATAREGVFAGGDVQTGPWVAIGAIAAGREAAESIVRYFDGRDMKEGREPINNDTPVYRPIPKDEPTKPRAKMPEVPPEERKNDFREVELGLDEDRGREEASRCLNCGYCCECFQCVKACGAGAVTLDTHSLRPETVELDVGSIIVAPGFQAFDPSQFDTYNYAQHPNVMTAMEFERILSASGPTMGHLVRLSDHKEPKKIAWLQCVGSRDINRCDNAYCSSVCCMYAIKEAVIAKEHAGEELDCTIFFMDMRTHGKEFERYYDDAREKHGIRFVRSRIHSIEPMEGADDLIIKYVTESGEFKEEEFDLVVLSVGLQTSKEALELAEKLGIELSESMFTQTGSFSPVTTSRDGVYVCGAFQGPKDIPQSVIEASAAAAEAGTLLAEARNSLTKVKEIPEERNVKGERPRIGVFVCQCGINIGGVVDVPAVRDYAATLPYVDYVTDNLYTCSQDTQEAIARAIKEHNLNRIVVAACTPKTHEPLFQETLVEAGLNKYLFEMTNIRNQDSWVHKDNPEAATEKAKDLVRMAVAKVALMEPLEETELEINQKALVVGGGISGLTAAKHLSDQGYQVYLVDRDTALGGQARSLYKTWKGEDVQKNLAALVEEVRSAGNIDVRLGAEITNVEGFVGNFKTTIRSGEQEETIEHGIAILATGGYEYKPDEYLYGEDSRVLTHLELDQRFMEGDTSLKGIGTAVFIQCVGSREPGRPYCSRVCCAHTMESALHLKELNPDMDIYVLYRDIRTYGERELLYRKARESGVVFIRYSLDSKPVVKAAPDGLEIQVVDHVLQRPIVIKADLLALASAILPYKDEKLAQFFKVPLDEDGFFVEAHPKLAPSEFSTDGVFLCGMAHYPKPIDESIAQAQAAVSRAVTLLARKKIRVSGTVAYCNPAFCSSCGVCVSICPYSAPSFIKEGPFAGKVEINSALCKGCGLCVASCRSGALNLKGFEEGQIMAMINEM